MPGALLCIYGGLQCHSYFLFKFCQIKRFYDIEIRGNRFHILLKGVVGGAENNRHSVKLVSNVLQQIKAIVVHSPPWQPKVDYASGEDKEL